MGQFFETNWNLAVRAFSQGFPRQITIEFFWYLTFATLMWVGFYWLFNRGMKSRRISQRRLESKRVAWEVIYSFRSMIVFAINAGMVLFATFCGWTRIYFARIDEYGWTWLILSVPVLILGHDTYFYWTHRAMHHPWLFRRFHRIHHLSTNPTPWAAYSFSIPEAFVQAWAVALMVFLIPLHPYAILTFTIYRHFFSVLGHSGFEVFPKWFLRSPLGWFFNTNTHHHQHHEVFNANYGLYFNFWDRLMGTNHEHYVERFEQVVGAPREKAEVEKKASSRWLPATTDV